MRRLLGTAFRAIRSFLCTARSSTEAPTGWGAIPTDICSQPIKIDPGVNMTGGQGGAREAQWLKWRSVAELYHAYFTGLILSVVTRRGTADAAEFVFRVFRRQQQERFLPGLEKLGLSHLPPAVAAAQYHYLSNWIGGVSVEYMYQTDRKSWICYPPPPLIWRGTPIFRVARGVARPAVVGVHAHHR